VAVDNAGNLYVTDSGNNRVLMLPAGWLRFAAGGLRGSLPSGRAWRGPVGQQQQHDRTITSARTGKATRAARLKAASWLLERKR
jgi:NHL repeat